MHQAVFHCCTDPAALRLRAADGLLEGYGDLRADIGFPLVSGHPFHFLWKALPLVSKILLPAWAAEAVTTLLP